MANPNVQALIAEAVALRDAYEGAVQSKDQAAIASVAPAFSAAVAALSEMGIGIPSGTGVGYYGPAPGETDDMSSSPSPLDSPPGIGSAFGANVATAPPSAPQTVDLGINLFGDDPTAAYDAMAAAHPPSFNGIEGTMTRAESAAALRGANRAGLEDVVEREEQDDDGFFGLKSVTSEQFEDALHDADARESGRESSRGNAFSGLESTSSAPSISTGRTDAAPALAVAQEARDQARETADARDQANALSNSWGASALTSGVTPSQSERDGIAQMQDAAAQFGGLAARADENSQRADALEQSFTEQNLMENISNFSQEQNAVRDSASGLATANRGLALDGERGINPDYGDEGQPALVSSTPTFAVSVPAFAPSQNVTEDDFDESNFEEGTFDDRDGLDSTPTLGNAFTETNKDAPNLTEGIAPTQAEQTAQSQDNSNSTGRGGNAFSGNTTAAPAVAGFSSNGENETDNTTSGNAFSGTSYGEGGTWGGQWGDGAWGGINSGEGFGGAWGSGSWGNDSGMGSTW